MHKSITVLLAKGLVAWLIVAVIYLIGGVFISASNAQQIPANGIIQSAANFWPSITVTLIVLFLYGALILYITLDWITYYFILDSKSVISHGGIISSKEESYDMAGIESVEVIQGLLGRLFNFGTLVLFNPILEKELTLRNIPDPCAEAQFIEKMHPNPEVVHIITKKQKK